MYSLLRPFLFTTSRVVLGATLALAATVASADDTFLGVISLIDDPQVAAQLDLSPETAEKIKALAEERESEAIDFTLDIKDLPADERAERLAEFRAETESKGLALLTAEQQAKLKQIQVSRAGVQAFADPKVAEQLGLTPEQTEKVTALLADLQRSTSQGSEAQRQFARARLEREIVALLTPEQKATWEKLTGRVAADADAPKGSDAPMPGDMPGDAAPADAPQTAGDAPRPSTPSFPSRSPSSSGSSRGSFGSRGSSSGPSAPSTSPTPSTTRSSASTNASKATKNEKGEVLLTFQFRYAPWKDVLDWFAEQAEMSLVMDAPPQGTFNYSDTKAYTPAQAIDLLNSVLLTKGYTLVRRERMLMLVNLEDGRVPDPLVPDVSLADLDKRGEFELIRVHFKLNKLTPEEAEPELRKLIGPQGAVVMLPKARQVLVTETAGRLRAIRDVIEAIENPQIPQDEEVAVIELQFISPSEFLTVGRQLLGMPENANATPDGSLRLAVDELGRRILATGKKERLARLQEIVKLVDVGMPGSENAGAPIEQPQLEVYSVTNADPASVLQVMQTLLAGLPDVRLTTDPKTGNLVALAKPSQHATIKATLDQLQRDGSQVEVIKLRRLDPQAAVLAINKLFGGTDQAAAANGPKVDADPTSMQLLIRGNAGQVAQVKDLLTKMGETDDGAYDEEAAPRDNIRILPLTGRSLESALEQIEGVWPTMHRNRIRIVRPSQSAPQIRTRSVPPLENVQSELEMLGVPSDIDPETRQMLEDRLRPLDETRPAEEPRSLRTPPGGSLRVPPADLRVPPADLRSRPAPAEEKPAPSEPSSDRTTQYLPSSNADVYYVAQIDESQSERAQTSPRVAQAAPSPSPTTGEIEKPAEQKSVPGADIVVTVGPGGIMIASQDLDALDDFEDLLRAVVETNSSSGREYTVFYLRYARAEVAASLLQEAIGGGLPSDDEGGGSLMGDIAASMMGDAGGGLLGGLLGLGGGGGGGGGASATSSTGVSVIPDPRLNALMVLAKPKDIDMIEQLLQVIDQQASPENVQTVAPPRFIPVLNSDANEIATVVRQVYASRLAADASQPRQPSPEDLIRALRGGRGGRGGGGGGSSNRGEEQKMTIGVDARSNSLIVSAPDYLFLEVKKLVEELDSAVLQSDETVRVVTLKRANADLVQRSLTSVLGDSIKTNKTASTNSSSNRSSSSSRSGSSSQSSSNQMRQNFEMLQSLQRSMGSGGRGGFSGGGRGGPGGGGFGGGGGRGGFGGRGGR